jgi:hypothetical protein
VCVCVCVCVSLVAVEQKIPRASSLKHELSSLLIHVGYSGQKSGREESQWNFSTGGSDSFITPAQLDDNSDDVVDIDDASSVSSTNSGNTIMLRWNCFRISIVQHFR